MFLAGVSVVPTMLTDVGIVRTFWEVLQQRPVDGRGYQWRLQIIAPQCNERHIVSHLNKVFNCPKAQTTVI
jgi:hypothetical protein